MNSVTGASVAEAHVSLVDTKTRKSVAQQKSSEGGRFEFDGLPAGKFSLDGAKRGFISASYEQHEQYSTAIVTGPDLKTDQLMLRLNPVALIGGHVRDENGDPVRHAQVTLFREDHRGGTNRVNRLLVATSDDLGYFDFSSLIPGDLFRVGQRGTLVRRACGHHDSQHECRVFGRATHAGCSLSEHLLQRRDGGAGCHADCGESRRTSGD